MHKYDGAKAPQSAAQRKAAQRDKLKAKGLKMVVFPETWAAEEKAQEIKIRCAKIIKEILGGKDE